MRAPPEERSIVLMIGAVQLVNILDFMMVMPLGPDFARALSISSSKIGLIGGSYTAAASVAGVAGSFVLDRFDRRKVLATAMLGLVCGTAAGGFATDLLTMVAARVIAGFFGGPATSTAFSIIADVVPETRRGKAVGSVMSAFSVASVLGVPIALELARQGGWRLPFFTVAGMGLLVSGWAVWSLPPMRGHLKGKGERSSPLAIFGSTIAWLSYSMTAIVMTAGFLIIPNISAYLQQNLGYPRARLGLLYLVGGAISFFAVRWIGRQVDRFGSFYVGSVGAALLTFALVAGFILPAWWTSPPAQPLVLALFVTFMLAMSVRNVAYNTLTSKVPRPAERSRFMSLQSAVQHLSSAFGAIASSALLAETSDHRLAGMERVAAISIALTCLLPAMLWLVERRIHRREPTTALLGQEPQSGLLAEGP